MKQLRSIGFFIVEGRLTLFFSLLALRRSLKRRLVSLIPLNENS